MFEEQCYLGQEVTYLVYCTLERGRHVSPKRRNIFIILYLVTHQKTVLFYVINYSPKGRAKNIHY